MSWTFNLSLSHTHKHNIYEITIFHLKTIKCWLKKTYTGVFALTLTLTFNFHLHSSLTDKGWQRQKTAPPKGQERQDAGKWKGKWERGIVWHGSFKILYTLFIYFVLFRHDPSPPAERQTLLDHPCQKRQNQESRQQNLKNCVTWM